MGGKERERRVRRGGEEGEKREEEERGGLEEREFSNHFRAPLNYERTLK